MLLTVYSNELSNNFRVDLKDNIILPPYTTIKMTNALLSLAHNFVIEEDTPIKIRYNNVANSPNTFVINAGTYTLAQLAQHIELRINQNANNNGIRNMKCSMTYDLDKGYNAGCFNIQLELTSLDVNLFRVNDWTVANFDTFSLLSDTALIDNALITRSMDGDENYMGATALSLGGTNVESWAYCSINKEVIIENWLEPTTKTNQDQTPTVHKQPYGSLIFKDNDQQDTSYAVLLNSADINFASLSLSNGDFDAITEYPNTPIVILYQKSNGTVDGEVVIYENPDGSGLTEVYRNTLDGGGEFIGVSLSNGNSPEYFYASDGDDWTRLQASPSATGRFTFNNGDNLRFGFTSYGICASTDVEDLQISSIFSSGKINTDINLNGYGQYVELDWNNNNNNDFGKLLGFDEDKYISDTTSSNPAELAKIDQSNEDKVSVLGYSTGAKTAPYINVNIDNLPIVSYGCNSTDDQFIGQNKCIASIPRYDFQGDFELNYNLVYNPVEANVIRLNNANEISLSSLDFRLQQADGTYPIDIVSPKSFVLDLQSEENIKSKHFKM